MHRFSRLASAFVAIVLITPALIAAEDLSGKWSGSFNISMNGGESRESTVFMVAKHSGKELTGTVGPNEGEQWPIVKGTVTVTGSAGKEATKASFDVHPQDGGPPLHVELELVGGRLKGVGKAEDSGMSMSAVLDMARVK